MPKIEDLKEKLSLAQYKALEKVLKDNPGLFSKNKRDIGCCNFTQHQIDLIPDAVPHREGARKMAPWKADQANEEIRGLQQLGLIEPAQSPWACGVVMAKKKGNQLRLCCDFRNLNDQTVKDAYPIPRIDESLARLGNAKYSTTLDLGSAFWHLLANLVYSNGRECPLVAAMPQRPSRDSCPEY